jgi:predicted transcriptional regulator
MNDKAVLRTRLTEIKEKYDSDNNFIEATVKKHTFIANGKEEFFFVYSSMLAIFNSMEQSEIRVLGFLLRYADGTVFSIDKPIRIEIAKVTNLSERTIYNTVKALASKNLIFKHPSGAYQINPRYAYRGSVNERNNQLKAFIEIGCEDC